MIEEKEKAAALTATKSKPYQAECYPKDPPASSLKLQIGEILLALHTTPSPREQEICLSVFDRLLRDYLDGRDTLSEPVQLFKTFPER